MHGRQDERLPLKLKRAFGALIIFFVTLQYDTLPSHQHNHPLPPLCLPYVCPTWSIWSLSRRQIQQLHVRGLRVCVFVCLCVCVRACACV